MLIVFQSLSLIEADGASQPWIPCNTSLRKRLLNKLEALELFQLQHFRHDIAEIASALEKTEVCLQKINLPKLWIQSKHSSLYTATTQ